MIHFLNQRGWIDDQILRDQLGRATAGKIPSYKNLLRKLLGKKEAESETSCAVTESGAIQSTTQPQEVAAVEACACTDSAPSFRQRLLRETIKSTVMVFKFMLLAFFLEALIVLYVPEQIIQDLLGGDGFWSILSAALLGLPVYTSNLAALPLVGSLLEKGMNPGAALAFLVAGPTTTLPAMAAVWVLATKRVFAYYVGFTFIGAILSGLAYNLYLVF